MKSTTLVAAASAAAVAAAGAYAVGSQRSDGSAVAAGPGSAAVATQSGSSPSTATARLVHGPRDLSGAASALGVGEAALRTALEELRAERGPKAGRADLAGALAKALGRTQAQVTAALEAVRRDGPGRRGDSGGFAAALASELGVPAEKVRTALTQAHEAAHAERRREAAAVLARELGLSTARVAAALEAIEPDPADRGGRRGFGDPTEELAGELGIAEERVDEAFDALRAAHEREHEARERELADQLAAKLNIPKEKVRALVADGGLLGGPGHGGRGPGPGPGPGFPGGGRP